MVSYGPTITGAHSPDEQVRHPCFKDRTLPSRLMLMTWACKQPS